MILLTMPLSLRMHRSARSVNRWVLVLYITRPRGDSSYSISRETNPFRW
jgi:hypothetical protein